MGERLEGCEVLKKLRALSTVENTPVVKLRLWGKVLLTESRWLYTFWSQTPSCFHLVTNLSPPLWADHFLSKIDVDRPPWPQGQHSHGTESSSILHELADTQRFNHNFSHITYHPLNAQ